MQRGSAMREREVSVEWVRERTKTVITRGLRLLCRTAAPGRVTGGQPRLLFIGLSCPCRRGRQEDAIPLCHLLIQIVLSKGDCLDERIKQLGDT